MLEMGEPRKWLELSIAFSYIEPTDRPASACQCLPAGFFAIVKLVLVKSAKEKSATDLLDSPICQQAGFFNAEIDRFN